MPLDLDEIFGYYTVKYVKVKDRYLGISQKILMLLIFLKIGLKTIMYENQHLLAVPVTGSARANAQQPTMKGCDPFGDKGCKSDFVSFKDLPYCKQYDGSPTKADREDTLDKSKPRHKGKQLDCVYWDAPEMTRGRTPVPGTLFVPTRITETPQIKGCEPSAANGWTCDGLPWLPDEKNPKKEYFVADVEDFTILINQAFDVDIPGQKEDITGVAADFHGYVEGRPDLADYFTKHKGYIKKLEAKNGKALEASTQEIEIPLKKPWLKEHKATTDDFDSIFSLPFGDVFAIQDILKLADLRGKDFIDVPRKDGSSIRSQGAVITIDITYSNAAHWDFFGNTKPHYTISAQYMPMKSYKIVYEKESVDGGGKKRSMHDVNGLLFQIQVKGKIRVFDLTHMLTVLTTAMVSIAMATTLTDYAMSYVCGDMSKHYDLIKYQPSVDFGDVRAYRDMLKKEHKEGHDDALHKTSPGADAICEAGKARKWKSDLEALEYIGLVEQRLNRLDAMDFTGTGDDKKDPVTIMVEDMKAKFKTKMDKLKKSQAQE